MSEDLNRRSESLPKSALHARVERIDELLRRGRLQEAEPLCGALLAERSDLPQAWLLSARLHQLQGDFIAMLAAAQRAEAITPSDDAKFATFEALLSSGAVAQALEKLCAIERASAGNYDTLLRLSLMYTQCNVFADAERCARAALALRPDDPDALYNLAPAAIAMGKLDEAETLLDRVIAVRPDDWDAYYNRATLRKQSAGRNHVGQLRNVLAVAGDDARAHTAVGYALGKELEDLGETEEAFDHFARAALARRRKLSYRVEMDIDAMRDIQSAFGADFFARDEPGFESDAPIFVLGLPRSGTTLVDRILSSHSDVESRGELNDMALAVMRATAGVDSRAKRIARAAAVDWHSFGESYCRAARGGSAGRVHFIDKTPLNFLYIGLIAKALPNARIVHVRRHPLASCYAMYKTLFRMGYPFSYDLDDLARYYAAYERLMAHWDALFGARIIEIGYEDLIADQEGETRRLLAACGLAWAPACLAFHENASPSATASAAQVRQPIYRSSLEQWRRYETQLEPLAERLRAEGVSA